MFKAVYNSVKTYFSPSTTNQNLKSSDEAKDPTSSPASPYISSFRIEESPNIVAPYDKRALIVRLSKLFDSLMENEEYKALWEQVNLNVHSPLKIILSPPEGEKNYEKQASIHEKKCPSKKMLICQQKIFNPHSFSIFVNVHERTDEQIKFSLIFELYNAKYWPEHEKVNNTALSESGLALGREKVEFDVMTAAKNMADRINPEISKCSPRSLNTLSNFQAYLDVQIQGGHYDFAKSQFSKLKKTSLRKSNSSLL